MRSELERVRLGAVRAVLRASKEGSTPELDARLMEVENQIAASAASNLDLLFGLRADELEFLWAVIAATIDPELALHLPALGPRYGRTGISVAQFATLAGFDGARAARLGSSLLADNPLVRFRLVEPIDPRAITIETAWVAAPRIVGYVADDESLDPLISDAAAVLGPVDDLIGDSTLHELRRWIGELVAGEPCTIVIHGKRGSGRRTLARAASTAPIVALDLERLRPQVAMADAFGALACELRLSRGIPLISGVDDLTPAARRELNRFLDTCATPTFVISTTAASLEVQRPVFRAEIPMPSSRTRAELWRRMLPGAQHLDAAISRASLRFQLSPGGIRDAAMAATASAAARGQPLSEPDLVGGVRSTVEQRLEGLARRHATHLGWEDVVLAPDIREQLEQLIARVRNGYSVLETWGFGRHLPGPGVAALFSGPPGTGKTMLAGVIARTLGLDLFRVDLSQITSKWIGETEKQLDRVFDAAETGHAMLLFDEADSLFAKRTEVKGATERYANLEVNFLLQRIETFAGVAILTTNMDGSLDPAFRRRLAAHVRFPHPDREERAELWKRLVPPTAPIARDVDFAALAQDFPAFAGAQIRNALTTAAFLAASAGTVVDQGLLRRAASEETHAMGRIVTARES